MTGILPIRRKTQNNQSINGFAIPRTAPADKLADAKLCTRTGGDMALLNINIVNYLNWIWKYCRVFLWQWTMQLCAAFNDIVPVRKGLISSDSPISKSANCNLWFSWGTFSCPYIDYLIVEIINLFVVNFFYSVMSNSR